MLFFCFNTAILYSLLQGASYSAKTAVNDIHINNIAHAIIGRVHQILSKSSVNRPTPTLITSSKPTEQPFV